MKTRLWRAGASIAAVLAVGGVGAAVNLHLLQAPSPETSTLALPRVAPSTSTAPDQRTDQSGPGAAGPSGEASLAPLPPSSDDGSDPQPALSTGGETAVRSTTTAVLPADSAAKPYSAGDAGEVTLAIRDGRVRLESVRLQQGWSYVEEVNTGLVLELKFTRSTDGSEIDLHAQVESGALVVEVSGKSSPDD